MDKCPKCGAKRISESSWAYMLPNAIKGEFDCGSCLRIDNGIDRSGECKDRQIAQLEERLAAWRELGKKIDGEWTGYGWKNGIYVDSLMEFFEENTAKLRELGEI